MTPQHPVIIRNLGTINYEACMQSMRAFTQTRTADTLDEIWLLEHDPIFTLGQAGRLEHVLNPLDIPVFRSDRGGQVTYHGPGQIIVYALINLERKGYSLCDLVTKLEQTVIDFLNEQSIEAYRKKGAPGVYVEEAKIASIGLRIRRGCSYHGLSFNVDMNLEPFYRIHPCGYSDLKMTQLKEVLKSYSLTFNDVHQSLISYLMKNLDYDMLQNS